MFVEPKITVIKFEAEDIITTSTTPGEGTELPGEDL